MRRIWKSVLAWIGGLMGVTACEWGMVMYGCPYADFDVDITICDEEGNPIPGIEVLKHQEGEKMATSDENGRAKLTIKGQTICYMYLTDVDGEANGGDFDDLQVFGENLTLTQTEKGKNWYSGRYDATGNVKMSKKKAQEQ